MHTLLILLTQMADPHWTAYKVLRHIFKERLLHPCMLFDGTNQSVKWDKVYVLNMYCMINCTEPNSGV